MAIKGHWRILSWRVVSWYYKLQKDNYIHKVERGRPRSKMSTGVINSAGNDSELKVVAMGTQRRGADQEILASPEFGDWLIIKKANKRGVIMSLGFLSPSFSSWRRSNKIRPWTSPCTQEELSKDCEPHPLPAPYKSKRGSPRILSHIFRVTLDYHTIASLKFKYHRLFLLLTYMLTSNLQQVAVRWS